VSRRKARRLAFDNALFKGEALDARVKSVRLLFTGENDFAGVDFMKPFRPKFTYEI
jgi:hypothetical protein